MISIRNDPELGLGYRREGRETTVDGVGVKVEMENDSNWRVQGEVRLWVGVRS